MLGTVCISMCITVEQICLINFFSLQGPNCFTDNHPDVPEQRIRLFFLLTTLSEQCLGSRIYSVKTSLIIDNATRADAGNYVVNITFGVINPVIVEQIIYVVVGMCCTCMFI